MKQYLTKLAFLFLGVTIGVTICILTHIHQIDFWGIADRQAALEIEVQVLHERGLISDVTVKNMIDYMMTFDSVFGDQKEEVR